MQCPYLHNGLLRSESGNKALLQHLYGVTEENHG